MEASSFKIVGSSRGTIFLFGTNIRSSRVGIQEYFAYLKGKLDLEEKIFCYGLVKIEC